MKRNQFTLLACFFVACTVASISCKKDKEKSRSELIVGTWQLTSDSYSPAYDYDGDGTSETEAISLYEACSKDNLIIFNANNTGSFDEGATKCDPGDDQSVAIGWALTDSDTKIAVTGLGGPIVNILQLDNSTLKISYTFDESSTTYTNTQTFKRK